MAHTELNLLERRTIEDKSNAKIEPPRFYRRLFSSSQATLSSMCIFA